MTEKEKIAYAKTFIDKLANGINPLNDAPVSEFDVVNNVRISRCLFFVSDILRRVIDEEDTVSSKKEKKKDFYIPDEKLNNFAYSAYPISVSDIAKRLNELIDPDTMKKITYKPIVEWLIGVGVLEESIVNEKSVKTPTEKGLNLGISVENRIGYTGEYRAVVYNMTAQEFIVDNLSAILNFKASD